MFKKSAWQVRLGPLEWLKYTYDRPKGDPLILLGSVRRGMQVGALATNHEKQYLQVVGDHMTLLNSAQIIRAIAKSEVSDGQPHHRAPPRAAIAPVVIVKKRRTFSIG